MTNTGISPRIFLEMIERQGRTERIEDGIRALVEAYYYEHSDADELEGETWRALMHLGDFTFVDVETIILEVEEDLRTQGRDIKDHGE